MTNLELASQTVEYLEARIQLLDTKASILFAAVALFAGGIGMADPKALKALEGWWLGLGVVVAGATALLLVRTVRTHLFSRPKFDLWTENYIMWFDDNFPASRQDVEKSLSDLNGKRDGIRKNLANVIYVDLEQLKRKYRSYRWAARGLAVLIIWSVFSVLFLV